MSRRNAAARSFTPAPARVTSARVAAVKAKKPLLV
jgi:hypothetical protein